MNKAVVQSFDVFSVLDEKAKVPLVGCLAAVGSDAFLRDEATKLSIARWKIDAASVESHYGEDVAWVDVHDRLATRSLFDDAGHRTVVVKSADKFVSKYRDSLEKWATAASPDSTLILHLDTLASNTRLYKLIGQQGAILLCQPPTLKSFGNPPDDRAVARWVTSWGTRRHGLRLTASQTNVLVQRIGSVFGLLDCELAKLALFASDKGTIGDTHVDELVGGWRTKTAWDIADWIAEGKIDVALEEVDRLFAGGQNPVGLMAQISWAMRRFGLAATIFEQARNTGGAIKTTDALTQAGFFGMQIAKADSQLRRIGSARALHILDWLVELDLKLKGTHSSDSRARFAVEEFVLRFV